MELILGAILIIICIIVMFTYVIKVVKFIKTEKNYNRVIRKKIKKTPTNAKARKK